MFITMLVMHRQSFRVHCYTCAHMVWAQKKKRQWDEREKKKSAAAKTVRGPLLSCFVPSLARTRLFTTMREIIHIQAGKAWH